MNRARVAQRAGGRVRRGPVPGPGAVLGMALLLASCGGTAWQGTHLDPAQVAFADELGVELDRMEQLEPGLYIQDLAEGMGPAARRGDLVSINFALWLADGSLVDTSVGGEPFQFRVGRPEVIKGWNAAIPGMKVGGRRKLVIRPGLGYGSAGSPNVPSNATLVFEVQLLDVR